MHDLTVIVLFGLAMSAIALSGGVIALLAEATLRRLVLPLVALSSGSLIGGALFHMLPAAIDRMGNGTAPYLWLAVGFAVFLILEQVLQWHHCHRLPSEHHRRPLGYLVLVADGVHNLLGGLGIGALFLSDFHLGLTAWLAAAAHELPQELGDFGVLIHSGWTRRQALVYNFASGLTFLVGGVLAWAMARQVDVSFLIPFACGNFLYIGAVDLIPEFKGDEGQRPRWSFSLYWVLGMALLLGVRCLLD